MKTHILSALTLGALLSIPAFANVSGSSSNTDYIQVGGTELSDEGPIDLDDPGHTGQLGSPGIGVFASDTPYKKVALSGLEGLAKWGFGGRYNWRKQTAFIDETLLVNQVIGHGDFGNFAFSKMELGREDDATRVYFGEWNDEDDITDGSHTVYYVGQDKTSNIPTTGSATYNIRGINDIRNSNILTGKLTANFVANTIGGEFNNNSLTINIDNNTIDPSTASFSGSARATVSNNPNKPEYGTNQREFFGDAAAMLGGMATFDNNVYDTAYAGEKQ